MNRIVKTAVLSLALGATTLAALPANAGDWAGDWRWHDYGYHHRHHNGDAVAAGIVGLAAGALIGGALASQPPPPDYGYYDDGYYDRPAYVVRRSPIVRPAPVRDYPIVSYRGGIEPWTRDWYDYCSDRYRTFNARTGTFTGYDGEQHFCVAN